MKASLCVAALVAAASAAPQLLAGHGAVGGLAGHGLVGGVAHAAVAPAVAVPPALAVAPAVAVGAGQVSHQSVVKPLQGENRGVTQSKAFGSTVAAVADHPSTTHGVGANRVRTVGVVSSGLVGHGGLVGGVGHGVVGGFGHGVGVGGVFNGYTGYNGTPFLNAAIAG